MHDWNNLKSQIFQVIKAAHQIKETDSAVVTKNMVKKPSGSTTCLLCTEGLSGSYAWNAQMKNKIKSLYFHFKAKGLCSVFSFYHFFSYWNRFNFVQHMPTWVLRHLCWEILKLYSMQQPDLSYRKVFGGMCSIF